MAAADQLEAARQCLDDVFDQLARHGVDHTLRPELRAVPGLLSHYDSGERCVYVGVRDPARPESRLMVAYVGRLMALEERRLLRLFQLLLPWTVAHELAHHLRYRCGREGSDEWRDERVAHQLSAAIFRALPVQQREEARHLVHRGLDGLASRLDRAGQDDPARILDQHLRWVMLGLSRDDIGVEGWVRAYLNP